MIAVQLGPRTIYEKVTNQSLRRMNPKLCRSFLLLDNADQRYIVPALKRCVELFANHLLPIYILFGVLRFQDDERRKKKSK